jgi:hypothetical protein
MGWGVIDATDEARKTCEMEHGLAGPGAKSMIRLETSDLHKLPDDVARKIRDQPNRKAAVGACRANQAAGFARYRIAVLFF